jgi:hypothetical protein
MKPAPITKEDVLRVAKSINKTVTDKQIERILEMYSAWEEIDTTATWDLIVEDVIYFVIFDKLNNDV